MKSGLQLASEVDVRYYSATYDLNGTIYSSFIFADSLESAISLAVHRNINERVSGDVLIYDSKVHFNPQPLPSDYYRERQLVQCAHVLSFYCWIACRAKIMSELDSLCDDGLLHEVLHELEFPHQFSFRSNVYRKLTELERIVPGLRSKPNGHSI